MSISYTSSLPRSTRNRSRVTSDIFRPPATPSSTSTAHLNDYQATGEFFTASRKRPRVEGLETSYETPNSARDTTWPDSCTNSSMIRSGRSTSPPPLVNTRYRLSGGLDTPTQAVSDCDDCLNGGSESDFRRRWTSGPTHSAPMNVVALQGERNGRKRGRSSLEPEQQTWGHFVYSVVGGLAGKVWNFCRASAFQGFKAGGDGAEYTYNDTTMQKPTCPTNAWTEVTEPAPLPGHYPDDIPTIVATPPPSAPDDEEFRPAKRLQTSQGNGWVMVNHTSASSPHSRPLSSHRSLLPRPTTTRRPRPSTARLTSASPANPPYTSPLRRASIAPARSPAGMVSPSAATTQRSPASDLAAKREREERRNEASMRKLNQRLKDLIREGKAALATKVEVGGGEFGVGGWGEGHADVVVDEGFAEGSGSEEGRGAGKVW